jgi:hypothetical protein
VKIPSEINWYFEKIPCENTTAFRILFKPIVTVQVKDACLALQHT